jgi:multidrug resistance efflux pump
MEHTIAAPADGIVAAVACAVGDLVEEGAELITLAPPEADRPEGNQPADDRC